MWNVKMNKQKIGRIFRIILGFLLVFTLIPLIQVVTFWVIYFTLTHPVMQGYQGIKLDITVLSCSVGALILQIYILYKSFILMGDENGNNNKNK